MDVRIDERGRDDELGCVPGSIALMTPSEMVSRSVSSIPWAGASTRPSSVRRVASSVPCE